VDAGNEQGRVVVYPPAPGKGEPKFVTLPPHQSREWVESRQENPVLEYQPGCAMCSYPGEREYQVVFAYAYLAAGGGDPGLLACGLRSAPVPMPPKS
jgi:hypothetical protein